MQCGQPYSHRECRNYAWVATGWQRVSTRCARLIPQPTRRLLAVSAHQAEAPRRRQRRVASSMAQRTMQDFFRVSQPAKATVPSETAQKANPAEPLQACTVAIAGTKRDLPSEQEEQAIPVADTVSHSSPDGEQLPPAKMPRLHEQTPAQTGPTTDSIPAAPSAGPSKPSAPASKPQATPQAMAAAAALHIEQCKQVVARAPKGTLPLQQLLLEPSWSEALQGEMSKPYFSQLSLFVHKEYQAGAVFPPREMIFRALNSCPLDQVRVVILGQDPYPTPGHAMGLCFSVNRGVRVPQSLNNIYKELQEDCGHPRPAHGDLSAWSTQGVLMLNSLLTVRSGKAASHKGQGWETFTDATIAAVSKHCSGVVFMLWGKAAADKAKLVNAQKHHVLLAAHPSPLAAASGKMFVGCKHFSKANALLQKQGKPTINWCIE